MNVSFDLPDGLELVELSYIRGSKDWLWSAYVRLAGHPGTLQGRFGFDTAQAAIIAATQAATLRAREIRPDPVEPALKLDLTNL